MKCDVCGAEVNEVGLFCEFNNSMSIWDTARQFAWGYSQTICLERAGRIPPKGPSHTGAKNWIHRMQLSMIIMRSVADKGGDGLGKRLEAT